MCYSQCPRRYYFEYLDEAIAPIKKDIKKPRPELEIGNAVHVALCNYYKVPQVERNFQSLKQELTKVWKPTRGALWGFASLDEERGWFLDALKMLKTFYDYQFDDEHLFYVPDPYSREEFIRIPLSDSLSLTGKVDRIDEEDDGLHIVDYKTGKKQDDDDFQVMIYVLLAKEKFGRPIKKASYFYLRTGHWKTFTPGDGDEKITIEKVKRLVSAIQNDTVYEAVPSKLCGWCDFLEYCPKKKEALEVINGTKKDNGSKEGLSM